jgi:hypothetical protein
VLQEVANFFKGHGIGDFTFSRGRLVMAVTRPDSPVAFLSLTPICTVSHAVVMPLICGPRLV